MNAVTYEVVSLKELKKAEQKMTEVVRDYHNKHRNYLLTCLCETGLANAIVRVKQTGDIGVLRVKENCGSKICPYIVRFYPVRKDGNISLNHRYVPNFFTWLTEDMTKLLKDTFEIVGDDSAS